MLRNFSIGFWLSLVAVSPALAEKCKPLTYLMGQAEMETFAGQTASKCSKGAELVCYWAYDFRESAATEHFGRIASKLNTCLGEASLLPADLSVNHPDSYDLHEYERNGGYFAVSLKDKAQLGQSFVFFRVKRAE